MAEIIKYGMVFDKDLLTLLEKGMTDNAVEIVARSINWKRTVVERDEFDNSERQLLNFGHTLGHAIEIESGFEIPHGKAVAIGMHLITELAVKNGLCSKNLLKRLDKLLEKYGLPTTCEIPLERLVNRTLIDKKRKSDFITVVLPTKDGNCVLNKMTIENWKGFLISEY
jgi:3-dehydroquinate synthase